MPGPLIAVIGLGATGSAALYQLSRRGVRTIAFEQFELGHQRGSSHGTTRIIRLAHFENPDYVPLMRRAYELWRDLESVAKQSFLNLTGLVEIASAEAETIRGTLAAGKRHGLHLEILDARALTRRYPVFRIPRSFTAVVQKDGGFIEAARALDASMRIAKQAGAQIRSREKVLAIEPQPQTVRIATDRGRIECDGAVIAAGPWTQRLLPELRLPLRVTRQVVAWLAPDDCAQFTPDRFPVFILETPHGQHYGFPVYGQMGLKVAKHHHLDEAAEPDTYDRTVTEKDEAAIRTPLATYIPAANGRLLAAETCLYTMTPDNTFVIDRMPGFPHVVVASPCCGHGFKFSPLVGEILADLVIIGTTNHDIAPFRLQRFV